MPTIFFLRAIHFFFYLVRFGANLWKRDRRKPQVLAAQRSRIPAHLALLLVSDNVLERDLTEETFEESVIRVVGWCRDVGIGQLSVYDSEGVLDSGSQAIRARLTRDQPSYEDDTDSELEYPLTPPASDSSDSRPRSPYLDAELAVTTLNLAQLQVRKPNKRSVQRDVMKRRKTKVKGSHIPPLNFNIISRESSKPALASVARSYIRRLTGSEHAGAFHLSVDELNLSLEGREGLQPPDFLIVHHISSLHSNDNPLELYGFPPWQIRLTEIYHNKPAKTIRGWLDYTPSALPLEEEDFRMALDEFSEAQMRLGR